MNRLTPVFLVLLRLAIGWHIFFEGIEKVGSYYASGPDAKKPWTSEPYLRESSAPDPLGATFRWLPGDPTLERVTPLPLAANQDPGQTPPHTRFPPALAKEWDAYFEKFAAHYELNPEQRSSAETKFRQLKDEAIRWMQSGKLKVKRPSPSGTASLDVEVPVPDLVAEYRKKREQAREIEATEEPTFKLAATRKTQTAKADANRLRTELQAGVDAQTAEMKKALQALLQDKKLFTDDQRQMPPPGLATARLRDYNRLDWVDWLTRWGLTLVGACLLLGLFTRSACLGGAAYLLLFYLAMPPFPGLPEPARAEGHYLFVNKNLIEMLALLALATTRSGYWAGLDGLLSALWPWRRKAASPHPELVTTRSK